MKSSTPRPSARQVAPDGVHRRVGLARAVDDVLADQAAGEQRAHHLGRGAAAQRAGQRQHVAVGALGGGREDDRLGVGELGHRVVPSLRGPGPSRACYDPEPRIPAGARRRPEGRRSVGKLGHDREVVGEAGQVGKPARDPGLAAGLAVDAPAHPAGDRGVDRLLRASRPSRARPRRRRRSGGRGGCRGSRAPPRARRWSPPRSGGRRSPRPWPGRRRGRSRCGRWCPRSPIRCSGSAGSWWSSSCSVQASA